MVVLRLSLAANDSASRAVGTGRVLAAMTDRYAWLGPPPESSAVALVAQAAYHLRELDPLVAELTGRGIPAGILVPVVGWKVLHSRRTTVRRLQKMVEGSSRRLSSARSIDDLTPLLSAVVVMNDWGVPRHLVEVSQQQGIPTFGWVEGVQDYDDIDTGLERSAYRRVDHVFALGDASLREIGASRGTAVGSDRLATLWRQPAAAPAADLVLINSNFTYGVLTGHRQNWVEGVVTSAEQAGRAWVLSRHTAERGRSMVRASTRPVDELLLEASGVVSRFSTVALDTLALGVELVYHNPHGERVSMFQNGGEAFAMTTSTADLSTALKRPARPRAEVRAAASEFLHDQVVLDADGTAASRVADVIERMG